MDVNSINSAYKVNLSTTSTRTIEKKPNFKRDSFEGRKTFKEHLVFKPEKFFSSNEIIEGAINDNVVSLKKTHLDGVINTTSKIEGTLGDNQIEFNFEAGLGKDNHFKGTYKDYDFDLNLKTPLLKASVLSGTIDGEDFLVTFPGKITAESRKNADLITLLTAIAGYKIKVKDGQFSKLDLSDQEENDLAVVMASQMGYQTTAI